MIIYREVKPSPFLQGAIECYWYVQGNADGVERVIYPDGCADIIFNFGEPLLSRRDGKTELNREPVFVVGSMTKPATSASQGPLDVWGIRFKPAGLFKFLSVPLYYFTDTAIGDDAVPLALWDLAEKLRKAGPSERIEELERVLLSKLVRSHSRAETWEGALAGMVASNGQHSIESLCRQYGISDRQLERKFQVHIGVSPKKYAQILRFCALRKRFDERQFDDLMSLAWDLGYTDHSHLTRSFHSFAGLSPSEYLSRA